MIKQLLRIALSIGVSFAVIGLLLQLVSSGLPESQRPSVLLSLQKTAIAGIVGYWLVYLIALLMRALRYRLLLNVSGSQQTPTMGQMLLVTGVRNMVVDLLPARLGELGFVALLNKGYGVKLEHCISSLAVSIAFDLIALLVIVVVIVLSQIVGSDVKMWAGAMLASAIVLSLVAGIGLFYVFPYLTPKITNFITNSKLSLNWLNKLAEFGNKFNQSICLVRESGKTLQILSLSVAIRLLKYTGFYLLFMAVATPSFIALAGLPSDKIISALIGGELAASLPIPAFMSFGVYEAGGALVFKLLGVADHAATVVTLLCVHIWSQFMEYILGGILLVVFILTNKKMRSTLNIKSDRPQKKTLVLVAGVSAAVFLGGSVLLAKELRATKKMGAVSPPPVGQSSINENAAWLERSRQELAGVKGFVVWSSNRTGNHDIMKMSLPDMQITPLTTNTHTEFYPRVSPDGKRLLFVRSQQPWVSQRNLSAWDLVLLDLVTMRETVLANNALTGNWLNDNEVTYLYNVTTVMKLNLKSMEKQVLYTSGQNNNMPAGSGLITPEYNQHTNQLLFTGLQSQIGTNTGYWGTAIMQGAQHRGILNGCQIAWSSDKKSIYQVTKGGRQGNVFMSINPQTYQATQLLDLEGEFSHEYWPKDSNDGRYIAFGASRSESEHEHDQADYEMFLWKIGSDPTKATRLTFHTGNDNWPDVYIYPH